MHTIDLNIDLTCVYDKKAVSGISLVENIVTFLRLGKNHTFRNLLDLLIF